MLPRRPFLTSHSLPSLAPLQVDTEKVKAKLAMPTPKIPEFKAPSFQAPSFKLDFKPPPALEVGACCGTVHPAALLLKPLRLSCQNHQTADLPKGTLCVARLEAKYLLR